MKHVADIDFAWPTKEFLSEGTVGEAYRMADSASYDGLAEVLQEIAEIVKCADSDDLEELTLP